jgi:polar amino acid transport system substrate-binding protein
MLRWGGVAGAVVLTSLSPHLVQADALEKIRSTGVLRFGSDAEGGAPYVFPDPANPETNIGYELDLMAQLGRELGVRVEFVQNSWDGLIPGLTRGNYDVAINGIEITSDRAAVVAFSRPYYVATEQLAVRRDDTEVNCVSDLAGHKVGTLKATLAERILRDRGDIEVVTYDSQISPYEDMTLGRLDGVLMDFPIALYYGKINPRVRLTDCEVGEAFYGIAVPQKDAALLREINAALDRLAKAGVLRQIYEDWGLWNKETATLLGEPQRTLRPATRYEVYVRSMKMELPLVEMLARYGGYLPILGRGALVTIAISGLAMMLAVLLGLILAVMRLYGPRWIKLLAVVYIEAVRGTPLLIQLYLIFYGLPNIGIRLSPFFAALIGLGCNYAVYEAENYRAGIQSVALAQTEAALSLGLTREQTFRHVILPQAFRVVIPPVTNDFIALFKDSSLVSVITLVELTKAYGMLAATYYDYIGIGLMTAALYFAMGYPFSYLARRVEKRLAAALR